VLAEVAILSVDSCKEDIWLLALVFFPSLENALRDIRINKRREEDRGHLMPSSLPRTV
jgi:hypothetical protein